MENAVPLFRKVRRAGLALLVWSAIALCVVGPGPCLADSVGVVPSPEKVRVRTPVTRGRVDVIVDNRIVGDVTISFSLTLENMRVEGADPEAESFVVRGGESRRLFSLRPVDPSRPDRYRYRWHWRHGDATARPDDAWVYRLPYEPGESFRVLQGYGGNFSHSGEETNALDFDMPEGTRIVAARDGLVIAVRDCNSEGAATAEYKGRDNFVLVQHSDGTIASYRHLRHGGAAVRAGQRVEAGALLGLSGNTGFSSRPHLHFMVERALDGHKVESLRTRFRTSEASGPVFLRQGTSYPAP